MDAKYINPFLEAAQHIIPQLGFQAVTRGGISVKEQFVFSKGVTILIGMTNQIRGNIAYNMTEETARKIASTMMMGMPVESMDDMAQSAISEMVNMITANAAINFEKMGMLVDISPPSLILGPNFKAKVSNSKFLVMEIKVNDELVELNIGLDS